MWFFRREPSKADLQGHRKVVIGTYEFTIRRVNPFLDFDPDDMPQIFRPVSRKKSPPPTDKPQKPEETRRALEDMASVLHAGVVSPRLVPRGAGESRGSENGITAEDLLRWDDVGSKLYSEIIALSLTKYRGLRGALELSTQRAALLDLMARRYGVRPSDLVFDDGEASHMERQNLDLYAATHGSAEEKKAMKKAEASRG